MNVFRSRVERLRRHLNYLRDDREFSGHTRFATDFSELHAYINPEGDEDDSVTLGIIPDAQVYFLALGRLFGGFSSPIYLLPPHVEELALHVSHAQRTAQLGPEYRQRARQLLEAMPPKDRDQLRKLAEITAPNQHDLSFVTTLVKGRFSDFCVDVAKYQLAFGRAHNALQKLGQLAEDKTLDLNLELIDLPLDEVRERVAQSEATVEAIYDLLIAQSHGTEGHRPIAKLRDARALVWLREINRVLKLRGERLILVSRDSVLESAIGRLSNNTDFDWPDAHVHLRGLHTIYLDYLSRAEGADGVSVWLERVDELLAPFEEWLERHAEHDNIPEELWQQTAQHWDEQANLRLSLLVGANESTWLTPTGRSNEKLAHAQGAQESLQLLRALWSFVNSQDYQKAAEREMERIWMAVQEESLFVMFAEQLPPQDIEAILTALKSQPEHRGASESIVVESKYAVSSWLEFQNRRLRNIFDELRGAVGAAPGDRYDMVLKALRKVIDAMPGAEDRAEGLLFVALILAIQERWPEALRVAQRAAQLVRAGSNQTGQFDYFIALTARKCAEASSEPAELWKKAYEAAEQAVTYDSTDARFLKERGTVALEFWISTGLKRFFGERSSLLSLPEWQPGQWTDAKQDLEAALHTAVDPRLKLDLLNNLAYMSLYDEGGIDIAEEYVTEIRRLLGDRPSMYPLIFDTMTLVEGARGYIENKPGIIEEAQRKLDPYLHSDELSIGDKQLIRRTVETMNGWRSEFSRS
jgi:tetratricopeptide (TPR) repeat protein